MRKHILIDAHAHLNLYLQSKRFGKDIDSVLKSIEKDKILIISNSMDITSYKINKKIAGKCKYVIPAFGIHPWNAPRYVNKLKLIGKLIEENKFIGEIGLDYFFVKDKTRYAAQRKLFKFFLSKSINRVLSIHSKGAEKDVLKYLNRFGNNRAIIHWYSGDLNTLKQMIKQGFSFSITPEICKSKHIKKIVKMIPLKQLLTETDSPGGPLSYAKKAGTPCLVKDVIKEIAKLKNRKYIQIKKQVQKNFDKLTSRTL